MRILINQLKNVGDVVLATSAISLVRKKYPEAYIALMVVPRVAPFFEGLLLVDEIIVYDYKGTDKGVLGTLRFAKRIRKLRFDVSISLDSRLRPLVIALLAGISIRIAGIGIDQSANKIYRYLFNRQVRITTQEKEHMSETFMKVVRPFLSYPPDLLGDICLPPISDEEREAVKSLLKNNGKKDILLCIRGTHPEKNWPISYFKEVILTLGFDEYNYYIVGASHDHDYACQLACDNELTKRVHNLCGKTIPGELRALCDEADLLISVDTGTGHVCATTDTPIISIFLCTNPVMWVPKSENTHLLSYRYAYERASLFCPDDDKVKREIFPEDVVNKVREIFRSKSDNNE